MTLAMSWGLVRCAGVLLMLGLAAGCATVPREFPVTLEVDYGPAGKPAIHETVIVSRGATPEAATTAVFPIEKGSVCCDPRETSAIDGVAADPAANRWWVVSVNGSKKVSPYKTKLKLGDKIRWEYRQYEQ